jgi:hypothetical protein
LKLQINRKWHVRIARIAALVAVLMSSGVLFAYSVLTHEQIIDLAWTAALRPLILHRFPDLTEDQIKEAHAYAYGGSVIQDLGYYPFGSRDFSDLVHYVRTGDFVLELLHQSQNANEYAFALGALSHYVSDVDGHPAVNEAVALRYPKLRAKYGKSVRYAQDRTAHLKIEFGFDTLQVAKNRYASDQYHDFIGFQVAQALLERSFAIVYGLPLKEVLTHEDLAIGSYRYSVSTVIPQMTKVALRMHKKDVMRETPNFAKKKFLYRLSRSDYEREWGKTYTKPGVATRVLASLLRYFPKVGPFRGMGFDSPTSRTEDLYIRSINTTVDDYLASLEQLRQGALVLPNRDLDDGKGTSASEYTLADEAYASLLGKLTQQEPDGTSPELRDNIIAFYGDLTLPIETKKDPVRWQVVLTYLGKLKAQTSLPITDHPAL